MADDKEKWVTIAQVEVNNNEDESDSDDFTDFMSFLSTPVGTTPPPPPSPTKSSSIANTKLENVESTVADNSNDEAPINSNANNKAKPQLLSLPSYYVDSFHEHFFPHADDEGNDELVVRKKLSIPQRYVILYVFLCSFVYLLPRLMLIRFFLRIRSYAMSMARKPKTHLSIAFVVAVILSFLGLRFGNFKVAIE